MVVDGVRVVVVVDAPVMEESKMVVRSDAKSVSGRTRRDLCCEGNVVKVEGKKGEGMRGE